MGFLSGKKKVDAERGILEIKGTMNALTLRIRRLDTRMVEEQKKAKDAMSRGDRIDGWMAFSEEPRGRRQIFTFNPQLERIVLMPPLGGG